MHKRMLSWLLSAAMVMSLFGTMPVTASAAGATLDLAAGSIEIKADAYSVEGGPDVSNPGNEYTITQADYESTTTANTITVQNGVAATVTLNGVSISGGSIDLSGSGNLTIILPEGITNKIYGAADNAGIRVVPGAALTINGPGTLNVYATDQAAGIGGGKGEHCGTVVINGGIIRAEGSGGSGIGGGCGFGNGFGDWSPGLNGGNITINGGTVFAIGDTGIGGTYTYRGRSGDGGSLAVTGGNVTAIGRRGIGSGYVGFDGSVGTQAVVKIDQGATVQAYSSGSNYGAIGDDVIESSSAERTAATIFSGIFSSKPAAPIIISDDDSPAANYNLTMSLSGTDYGAFATTVAKGGTYTAAVPSLSKVVAQSDNTINFNISAAQNNTFESLKLIDAPPWPAYAASAFAGGDGLSATTPYQIATAKQLAYLASCTVSDPNYANGKYFVLTEDINLSAHEWVPITMFRGSLDGQNHKITALTIDAAADYQGLIAQVGAGAVLKNLTLENCDITGGSFVGALFGSYNTSGTLTVENCHSSGTVAATDYVGGLLGDVVGTSMGAARTVINCSSSCTVSSTTTGGNYSFAGGLMGRCIGQSASAETGNIVRGCFATGNVTGQYNIGGLVGWSANSSFMNCYATGNVADVGSGYNTGGLIGCGNVNVSLANCYASGTVTGNSYKTGGVIGGVDTSATVTSSSSYYNSLNGAGDRGVSETLVNMQQPNFTDTLNAAQSPLPWTTDSGSINDGFPVLRWQSPASVYNGEVDIETGIGTGSGWRFSENELIINENGSYRVYGSGVQTSHYITVDSGITATILLDNVNMEHVHLLGNDTVTVILKDGTTNTLRGSAYSAALRVPSGTTVTIQGESTGTGQLNAIGSNGSIFGDGAAGIGGNHQEGAGTIIINSGVITATGGSDNSGPGAGIGGGGASGTTLSGGTIAIHGGTVSASGGYQLGFGSLHAPGIGGYEPTSITIDGGDVIAYGGHYGINASSIAIRDEATVRAFSINLNSPAIMGLAALSGNTANLLSFSLDTAVLADTGIAVTQKGSAAETFTLTIPKDYRNFSTTVETSNLYTAALPDGSQKVAAVSDRSTEFSGNCLSAGSAFSSCAVKLEAVPPFASGVSISGTPTVGQTLTGGYTYNAGGGGAELFSTFRWLRVSGTPSLLGQPYLVHTTNNIDNAESALSGPTNPLQFTVAEQTYITKISTYHCNSAHQSGTISLVDADGIVYPPANTVAEFDYWCVYPDIEIPAGTYTVIDSHPESWSFNAASGNAGITEIAGYTVISGATAQTYTLQAADAGHSILFEITPRDTLNHAGPAVLSAPVGAVAPIPVIDAPVLQSAEVRSSGTKVVLTFDKNMSDPAGTQGQFSVSVNDVSNPVTAVSFGSLQNILLLTLSTPVTPGQSVNVSYTPGTVTSADGGVLASFTNQSVTNNVPAVMIGGTEYTSLAGALAAAAGTDTIVLISDITYSNAIKADTKDVTIDLNGFDLTVSGVAEHALQAVNAHTLTITDKDDDGGSLTVHSSGSSKYALFATSDSRIIMEGTVSAVYPGGDNQGIIGAFAMGVNAKIQVNGSVSGYTAGIYATNDAEISVTGNVSGSYYGAFSAYNGSVDVTGNISASRALVSEYGGLATVEGNITGSNYAVEAQTDFGWNAPMIRVTGNVTGTGGAAISAGNAADVEITGDVTGYVVVSGTDTSCPEVTINGDITLSSGFGVSVFYGGTVTVNGRILGASPYLKLNTLNIAQGDYNEISGDYYKYTNQTSETPAPLAANTVYVAIPASHTVTICTLSGGTITANPASAASGTAINLTITPAAGKQLKAGTLRYNDGSDHAITGTSFTMPAANVTVTALFENTLSFGGGGGGGGGGGTPTDTGTKVTVATTDGAASVTGTLTETNGGTQIAMKNDEFDKIDAADKPASVNAQLATVTFDKKAIDTIGSAAGSGDVSLSVRQVPVSELSEAVRALVGSRPVYDFTVTGDGRTISSFGGGFATVSIPYKLQPGENPHAVIIWYLGDNGRLVGVRGCYNAATGTVTFMTPHFSRFVIGYNFVRFNDVSAGEWHYDAISFIAARRITTGTGGGDFSPDAKLTRGQFIVMLLRAYGIEPNANPVDNFADAGNTYYTNHLATAKRLGISAGIGNNQFAPDKEITRQEMFTLLYHALKAIDELQQGASSETLSSFSDAGSIAPWARDAMTLLVETGTITGSDGKLSPVDSTTRAEMAQVLYHLLNR